MTDRMLEAAPEKWGEIKLLRLAGIAASGAQSQHGGCGNIFAVTLAANQNEK